MSNKGFKPLRANGNATRLVTFQILPNGTGTPTIGENPDGVLATVSRSGVGVIVATLNDTFLAVRSVTPALQLNAVADSRVLVTGATTVATTKTITFTTLTGGSAADIAASANNIIHVTAVMRDGGGQ